MPSPPPHPPPSSSSPPPPPISSSVSLLSTLPPPFTALFTLVSTASKTHHPTVHYLFSDDADAPHLLTTTALQTLSATPHSRAHSSPSSPSSQPHAFAPQQSGSERRDERILIVDLDAAGTRVVSAHSLSKEWQITNAEIGAAPTWEGEGEEGEKGLMLRVEGVEIERMGLGEGKGGMDGEGLEGLVEEFETRMRGLRGVLEGARGRRKDEA